MLIVEEPNVAMK